LNYWLSSKKLSETNPAECLLVTGSLFLDSQVVALAPQHLAPTQVHVRSKFYQLGFNQPAFSSALSVVEVNASILFNVNIWVGNGDI